MEEKFKPGFTWRSAFAIFIAMVVFVPISTYVNLVVGGGLPTALMMAIFFSEFLRLFGRPLTKQELFILYEMCAIGAGTTWYIAHVYKTYFVTSPYAWSFKINGIPLPELAPAWWVPPRTSIIYKVRTLLNPDWVVPILLTFLQYGILTYLVEISLTIMMSYLFIEVEKLPFPFASIDASLINTLSERDPFQLRLFTLSAVPGIIWGLVLFALPILFGTVLIPIPWIDFTPFTAQWFPGMLVGIATDVSSYLYGAFVPIEVATWMLIGSLLTWCLGNYLSLTTFVKYFPAWKEEYFYGMSLANVYARSLLRVWIVPQIAFSFALMLVVLLDTAKYIPAMFKALIKISPEVKRESGYPSLYTLLVLYLIGTVGSVVVFHIVVPDFPIWISVLISVVGSFLLTVTNVAAVGLTGYSLSAVGNVWRPIVYMSGYNGFGAWVFSPVIGGGSATSWTFMTKVGYLTETKPIDLIKALVFTLLLFEFMSLFWMELLWRIAPIPSAVYPYALASWPASVISDGIWITRSIGINPQLFLSSFLGMFFILLGGRVVNKFFGNIFSSFGLILGIQTIPPLAIPTFVGSVLGKFVFPKVFGEKWERSRSTIVAGFASGEGIAVGIIIGIALILKATWVWPW
jgi:hypothetical protein